MLTINVKLLLKMDDNVLEYLAVAVTKYMYNTCVFIHDSRPHS